MADSEETGYFRNFGGITPPVVYWMKPTVCRCGKPLDKPRSEQFTLHLSPHTGMRVKGAMCHLEIILTSNQKKMTWKVNINLLNLSPKETDFNFSTNLHTRGSVKVTNGRPD